MVDNLQMLVQKLVQPSKIERWAVVNFNARCDLRSLVSNLIKCGEMKGVVSNGCLLFLQPQIIR